MRWRRREGSEVEEGRRMGTARKGKGEKWERRRKVGHCETKKGIGRFPNQLPPQTNTALLCHADLSAGLSEVIVEALQLFHLSHKLATFLQLPGDKVAHPHTREEERGRFSCYATDSQVPVLSA